MTKLIIFTIINNLFCPCSNDLHIQQPCKHNFKTRTNIETKKNVQTNSNNINFETNSNNTNSFSSETHSLNSSLNFDYDLPFNLANFKKIPKDNLQYILDIHNQLKSDYKNKYIENYENKKIKKQKNEETNSTVTYKEITKFTSFIITHKNCTMKELGLVYVTAVDKKIFEISKKLNLNPEDAFFMHIIKLRKNAETWIDNCKNYSTKNHSFFEEKISKISKNEFFEILSVTDLEEWIDLKVFIQIFLISFFKKKFFLITKTDCNQSVNLFNEIFLNTKIYEKHSVNLFNEVMMANKIEQLQNIVKKSEYRDIVKLISFALDKNSFLVNFDSTFQEVIVFFKIFFLFFL